MFAGKKGLVIGGAGFIGSHVVDELLLTDIDSVVVYDTFGRGKRKNLFDAEKDHRFEVFPHGGDIRDIELLHAAMKGADFVFHLGALWLIHAMRFPRAAFDVNVAGTFNVLEACLANGVEKLVFSSSASVYGDAKTIPMEEDHPFLNKNFYGSTKIAGEAMATALYEQAGLNFSGLRYMNVYGRRQPEDGAYTGVIPKILNSIDKHEPIVVNGDGSQSYDFITARDVARCNVAAAAFGGPAEFYNVGTGIATSIRQLAEELVDVTGSECRIEFEPYQDNDARQMVKNRVGSTEKAERELGFRFEEDLRTGLMNYVEWRERDS